MRRDPFDEVCACEYDEPSRHRICTKRKEQAKGLCPPCQAGRHTLKRKGERISGNRSACCPRRPAQTNLVVKITR